MKINILLLCLILLLLFRILKKKLYHSTENTKSCMVSRFSNNKISFCFLVYDKINKEDIWNEYLSNIDPSLYSMYIHYKQNISLQYFSEYKLDNCIDTCWGCYNLVQAQILLIKEALKDVSNTHVIILTQACLPFKSFRYIQQYLKPNKSYFNIAPDEQVFPRCDPALKYLPRNTLKKAGMGAILSRKHAELLVKYEDKLELWFKDVTNPDEHAIISLLFYLGLENELELTENHAVNSVIMSQWPGQPGYKSFTNSILKLPHPAHPNTYIHVCQEELYHFINAKCLFGRKFLPECTGLENLVTLLNT